jgi:hypothetical protein
MECFRVDESGYTGFDLLNPDQRFQGASAIAITDEDAARLIKNHFPHLQAPELKYTSLTRRTGNHQRIHSLLRDILSNYKCVTYVCDKRFLLVLMFVDYAVEPFYYERGVNFYENGQNYAMASLLSMAGPTLLGQPAFDNMLAAFQNAVKVKTSEALKELVVATQATRWRELPEALGPLAQYSAPECFAAIATPGVNTDAAIVVLQSLISRMETLTDTSYRVEHDSSKNLLTYHDLLRRFIEHDQEVEFRLTEITSMKFPLKLAEVAQVDSKMSAAVQLADVMIGAAIEATKTITGQRSGGPDPEKILTLYGDNQFIHLLPSLDFDEQKRFRQSTQSAELIDYFSTNFSAPRRN